MPLGPEVVEVPSGRSSSASALPSRLPGSEGLALGAACHALGVVVLRSLFLVRSALHRGAALSALGARCIALRTQVLGSRNVALGTSHFVTPVGSFEPRSGYSSCTPAIFRIFHSAFPSAWSQAPSTKRLSLGIQAPSSKIFYENFQWALTPTSSKPSVP
jgi:hypothetical protein